MKNAVVDGARPGEGPGVQGIGPDGAEEDDARGGGDGSAR